MNNDDVIEQLKNFCMEYREHAMKKEDESRQTSKINDMQYYIGKSHAACDIFRELYRLQELMRFVGDKGDENE